MNRLPWLMKVLPPLCITMLLYACDQASSSDQIVEQVAEGLRTGDAAVVQSNSINADPKFVDALCAMTASSRHLHLAAVHHFGPDADKVIADVSHQAMVEQLRQNHGEMACTQIDGQWKVDFAKIPSAKDGVNLIPVMTQSTAANRIIADSIEAGKFTDADEAHRALKQQMLSSTILIMATPPTTMPSVTPDSKRVPLIFTGGFDTDPRDRGRPVVLVAAGLGVPADVFRDAFTHVRPAGDGQGGPTPERARENKQQLMQRLAPYGVTNDRLDEVSNYYRYQRSAGEMWKHKPASGYAVIQNGRVIDVVMVDAGAGYSSKPIVTVDSMSNIMPSITLTAQLKFTKDLATNGSIAAVTVDKSTSRPAATEPR